MLRIGGARGDAAAQCMRRGGDQRRGSGGKQGLLGTGSRHHNPCALLWMALASLGRLCTLQEAGN